MGLGLPLSREKNSSLRSRRASFSIFDSGFAIVDLVSRSAQLLLIGFEILILSALILAMRCANYQDVFVRGNIYFTDADCYARVTRARMCAEHPGIIAPAVT